MAGDEKLLELIILSIFQIHFSLDHCLFINLRRKESWSRPRFVPLAFSGTP